MSGQAYQQTTLPPCRFRGVQQPSSDGRSRDAYRDPWPLRHLRPHHRSPQRASHAAQRPREAHGVDCGLFVRSVGRSCRASPCAVPRIERFVWKTLERGAICFVIRLGRLRGWLVCLLLMLLSPSTRPTSPCLGIAILRQKRDRHNCDDEFRHRGLDAY